MTQPASLPLRWLYCLSVVGLLLPVVSSGWVSISVGRGGIGTIGLIPWVGYAILGIGRIYQVAMVPGTLDSRVYDGTVKVLRIIGIVGIVISVVFLAVRLGYRPLLRALIHRPSDDGIEYYVVGLYIALLAGIAPVGVAIFEFSRLLGFERHTRGG